MRRLVDGWRARSPRMAGTALALSVLATAGALVCLLMQMGDPHPRCFESAAACPSLWAQRRLAAAGFQLSVLVYFAALVLALRCWRRARVRSALAVAFPFMAVLALFLLTLWL